MLQTSQTYLAKLRDTVLAEAGVQPSAVKIVPLPSNTATCECGLSGAGWRGALGVIRRDGGGLGCCAG